MKWMKGKLTSMLSRLSATLKPNSRKAVELNTSRFRNKHVGRTGKKRFSKGKDFTRHDLLPVFGNPAQMIFIFSTWVYFMSLRESCNYVSQQILTWSVFQCDADINFQYRLWTLSGVFWTQDFTNFTMRYEKYILYTDEYNIFNILQWFSLWNGLLVHDALD